MDEKMAYWMSGYVDPVKAQCDEPVFAAMTFESRGLNADAVGRGALLGGWSMFGNRRAQQKVAEKAGGLPPMVILAVGPTKAYVFEYRTSGRSLDVDGPVAVWERDDLDVAFKKQMVSSPLVIDVRSTGEHFELESTSMTGRLGKMTAEIGRLLADPAAG